jgi:hypothetical protein
MANVIRRRWAAHAETIGTAQVRDGAASKRREQRMGRVATNWLNSTYCSRVETVRAVPAIPQVMCDLIR